MNSGLIPLDDFHESSLEHVAFEKCYSVHKPRGIPRPMGMKHLIEFSKEQQDELNYYPRQNMERLHKLVRMMAPEMFSRTATLGSSLTHKKLVYRSVVVTKN